VLRRLFLAPAGLGVVSGLKAPSAVTPGTGDLVRLTTQRRANAPRAAAWGARRAVLGVLLGRCHALIASVTIIGAGTIAAHAERLRPGRCGAARAVRKK
jgi:hypothetical protein